MAFCSRIGSLLKQSILQNTQTNGQISSSMLNSIRCMSSTKLFVGGLSYGTDDQTLRDAFSSFGDVVDARIITDRDTGRSRGFGFVNFADGESANSAMSAMDGQELGGRNIRVNLANDRPSAPRGGFSNSYGGGGSGYGDGYRGNSGFGGRSGGNDDF